MTEGLTPKEVRALRGIAQRAISQAERAQFGGAVTRNDWTRREARANGLRNSIGSLGRSIAGKEAEIERAEDVIRAAEHRLDILRVQLRDAQEQLAALEAN